MDKFNLSVVGFRSRVRKKHALKVVWRYLAEPRRQLRSRLIGAPEKIIIKRQFSELVGNRSFNSLLRISQVAAPQSRHTILNFIAIRVENINVLSPAHDTPPMASIIGKISERVQVVRLI
jgi:hypothetical protein